MIYVYIHMKTEHATYMFATVLAIIIVYQTYSLAFAQSPVTAIYAQVLPDEGFTLKATWGDAVSNMVEAGVLDPARLETILKQGYKQDMKPEWNAILKGEDAELSIDSENSVFMMYVLWTLAKHNNVSLIHESAFAQSFEGYDIGVGRAGYGDTLIINLTEEQLALARSIAQNSYRPCCGQSAANPDCSHGFAALGLIELMISQGFTENEIYGAFVKVNSFWFPSTYIQDAMYFKEAEGLEWKDVDRKLVAGPAFSSIQGAAQVKNYLQNKGY